MVASCSSALVNIILNFLLMNLFGYLAAAYTTAICYLILATAHYYFMKSAFRENVGTGSVYNIKSICLITLALVLAAVVMMLLYPVAVIRYAFVAVLLVVGVIKRKTIFSLIRRT